MRSRRRQCASWGGSPPTSHPARTTCETGRCPRRVAPSTASSTRGVEMILGGHLHRSYIGNSLDFLPRQPPRQGGSLSCNAEPPLRAADAGVERNENTFNLIEVGPDILSVTHFMYFEDQREFAPLSRHLFPRAGKPLGGAQPLSATPDTEPASS